jgi:hypothetical protein
MQSQNKFEVSKRVQTWELLKSVRGFKFESRDNFSALLGNHKNSRFVSSTY